MGLNATMSPRATPLTPSVTDLSDTYPEALILAPVFRDFGGQARFSGRVATVRVRDHNPLVRAAAGTPGEGRVLVVDGGGSLNCALLGDDLAGLAALNGWAGLLVNGCVRDVAALRTLPLGIRALAAHPRRSGKTPQGEVDVPVTVAGVTLRPGMTVHADEDGVLALP